jgi:hypothetical protein
MQQPYRGYDIVEAAVDTNLPLHLATACRSFGRPTNRYCIGFRMVLAPSPSNS